MARQDTAFGASKRASMPGMQESRTTHGRSRGRPYHPTGSGRYSQTVEFAAHLPILSPSQDRIGKFHFSPEEKLTAAVFRQHAASTTQERLGVSRGGWQGPKTLFEDPDTETLQDEIRQLIPCTALHGWGTVMQSTDTVGVHNHTGYHQGIATEYSGICYLNTPEGSGETYFPDIDERIIPESGLMLIFPHDLNHGVLQGQHYGLRVAIAFNAGGTYGG